MPPIPLRWSYDPLKSSPYCPVSSRNCPVFWSYCPVPRPSVQFLALLSSFLELLSSSSRYFQVPRAIVQFPRATVQFLVLLSSFLELLSSSSHYCPVSSSYCPVFLFLFRFSKSRVNFCILLVISILILSNL